MAGRVGVAFRAETNVSGIVGIHIRYCFFAAAAAAAVNRNAMVKVLKWFCGSQQQTWWRADIRIIVTVPENVKLHAWSHACSPTQFFRRLSRDHFYLHLILFLTFLSCELIAALTELLTNYLLVYFKMGRNPCFALLWIIVLFIAWAAAFLAAGLWIFLQPFEACFGCIKDCNSCLEGYITWPRRCGEAIANCSSSCPQP